MLSAASMQILSLTLDGVGVGGGTVLHGQAARLSRESCLPGGCSSMLKGEGSCSLLHFIPS